MGYSFTMRVIVMFLLCLWPPMLPAAQDPQQATLHAMGGIPVNISAWGMEQAGFDEAVVEIEARIAELEAMLSTFREDSPVSRFNRVGRISPTPAPFIELIESAKAISVQTGGAFDITVMPLVQLWKKCVKEERLPADSELAEALVHVGYGKVNVDSGATLTGLDGVMLDFGGIAKGYFADQAVAILREAGASRCLVDVGGDITTWQDTAVTADLFRVGIRDPYGGDSLFAVISVPTGAVVTSGNYERYYEIQGKRYCHIFDPRTGLPVEGMLSVTLLAPGGMQADALATAVFVMGAEEGSLFVEKHAGIEAVIVRRTEDDGIEVYLSPGLVDAIEFADL